MNSYVTWEEAESELLAANRDFHNWRKSTWGERSAFLERLAESLKSHKAELVDLMNLEMGKLVSEGAAEVDKCVATCLHYALQGPKLLQNQKVNSSPYVEAEIGFKPLGVIFSIMPWNFPVWQVIRFAAPAIMAGNVVVLKHADITAKTGALIGKIFTSLSAPNKLLRNVHVDHEVAAKIIGHPLVRGVTFTGSTQGGRSVAVEAAKNLKKIVLELGGSDPYLILKDADLELAAKACARTRLINCGQSCVAGKRFIVVKEVASQFILKFINEMQSATLAPLASRQQKKRIVEQVAQMKALGGDFVLGGAESPGEDSFYPASVVVFSQNSPEIHQEEIFGPVAIVIVVEDEQEAIAVANSSPFGLGGGVFTKDWARGKDLVEQELEAGFVVVNDFVKSDARLPFGGIKDSGYGRELGSFGLLEFVNVKTIGISGVST